MVWVPFSSMSVAGLSLVCGGGSLILLAGSASVLPGVSSLVLSGGSSFGGSNGSGGSSSLLSSSVGEDDVMESSESLSGWKEESVEGLELSDTVLESSSTSIG